VESLTDQVEAKAEELLTVIAAKGGAVAAIEEGWMQAQIEESAYREAQRQGAGESVVVGVNRFVAEETERPPILEVDPSLEAAQVERLHQWRSGRDGAVLESALAGARESAEGEGDLMGPIKEALAAGGTVGEVSDVLRAVFGEHRPF